MISPRMRHTRRLAAAAALLTTATLMAPGTAAAAQDPVLDRQALQQSLDAAHKAGMYGMLSTVRDGNRTWQGATGVADVTTERPMHPRMTHRVGSISKTFASVAVLQQVASGTIELDAPIGRYLPDLVSSERGEKITVRMLLNHTSHIADYLAPAFPSLLEGKTGSLDEHRFRKIKPAELVKMGLEGTPTGEPGATPGSYSNTNYVIIGLLLEKVTGENAERHITRNVIRKAGLRHTSYPRTPRIPGAHSKAYESWYGLIDPPRDYSVYDMSFVRTAGDVVSTMDDLNRFYRELLRGRLVGAKQLAEMQKTVPVNAGGGYLLYGLGLYAADLPCGRFWGHDGAVFGMGAQSLSSPDGKRQISFGMNLMKYQRVGDDGQLEPSEIDNAMGNHLVLALCGKGGATAKSEQKPFVPFPTGRTTVKR
ncbi:class A beta-lactamase-related serine hydrolase [Nonomuraea longispora]|uniref:Class A beta-lactamase-related serine hydrolase n=1 Tax=Nonomuraea longispora TaxID=1848320 RepID=A0A4R4NAM6_9ACTN|nr:serine hydrolase domain-containing protein [Nonomuraea longispora]TDC05919.1 class A beta-lactamase-related serine hydrolase [Nonomuraea longispora]